MEMETAGPGREHYVLIRWRYLSLCFPSRAVLLENCPPGGGEREEIMKWSSEANRTQRVSSVHALLELDQGVTAQLNHIAAITTNL